MPHGRWQRAAERVAALLEVAKQEAAEPAIQVATMTNVPLEPPRGRL